MAKITKPENNEKSFNVIHIFNSGNQLLSQYILEFIPYEIKSSNIIIYLEPNETYEISKQKIIDFFKEFDLTIKSESIISVLDRSLTTLSSYNSSFKFVGLIDPLLKNNFLTLDFTNNFNLLYNIKNWENNPLNQKLLVKLADKLPQEQKEDKDLTGTKLIDYFFEKYKNKLI